MVYYLILCIIIINITKDLAILVHFKYVLIHKMSFWGQFAKSQHCGTQVQAKLESETLKITKEGIAIDPSMVCEWMPWVYMLTLTMELNYGCV